VLTRIAGLQIRPVIVRIVVVTRRVMLVSSDPMMVLRMIVIRIDVRVQRRNLARRC
jgi:hypothetical protein